MTTKLAVKKENIIKLDYIKIDFRSSKGTFKGMQS